VGGRVEQCGPGGEEKCSRHKITTIHWVMMMSKMMIGNKKRMSSKKCTMRGDVAPVKSGSARYAKRLNKSRYNNTQQVFGGVLHQGAGQEEATSQV